MCSLQAELGMYQRLEQTPFTAAIAAKAHLLGDLIIKGRSHPYMVMQRLGKNLEETACARLSTAKFVQVRLHSSVSLGMTVHSVRCLLQRRIGSAEEQAYVSA